MKRANLKKRFALLKKRYHKFRTHFQNDGYIADIAGFELMILKTKS